jgi:hypothetical protein
LTDPGAVVHPLFGFSFLRLPRGRSLSNVLKKASFIC